MLYNFSFYNYQTKCTQSVTACSWVDAWRQLGIRFGSPFLRSTFQPWGQPVPVGLTGAITAERRTCAVWYRSASHIWNRRMIEFCSVQCDS